MDKRPIKIKPRKTKIIIAPSKKDLLFEKIKNIARLIAQNKGLKYMLAGSLVLLICLIAIPVILYSPKTQTAGLNLASEASFSTPLVEPAAPTATILNDIDFGVDLSGFTVKSDTLATTLPARDFLEQMGYDNTDANQLNSLLVEKGLQSFNAGSAYFKLLPNDNTPGRFIGIIKIGRYVYVLIKNFPIPSVVISELPVFTKTKTAAGRIEKDLLTSLKNQGVWEIMARQMEDALKWDIDFYHIRSGDQFKIVYDERWSKNHFLEVGVLQAIYYKNKELNRDYYAFYFEGADTMGYYDQYGRPKRKNFLMSPVKFGRISSEYNPARLHPVLNIVRPHWGTDYAAPKGAPVFSVSDGAVEIASTTEANGNYIKIRHSKVYESQYLHLDQFAKGMKQGKAVKQGEVIGYVGKTGLATGPHVCFRFWKNGRQIDHRKETFTAPVIMSIAEEDAFSEKVDSLKTKLDKLAIR